MERRSRSKIILETQAKLITAARHAFATKGYSQTSMDDFTAEVGLTRGALYHHFKSKEGLLLAVIEQIESEVGQRLQNASDCAPSLWEGFRRRCHTYLELALEPEIKRIILQDARSVFGDVPIAAQSLGIAALESSLEKLIIEGTLRPIHVPVIARMIYGIVTEASFWIAEEDQDASLRLIYALQELDHILDSLLNK